MYGDSTRCAVVVPYKCKLERLTEASELADSLRAELSGIPGLERVIDIWNDNGMGYSVTIWESPEAKAAAATKMEEIWGRFDGMFDEVTMEEFANVERLTG